MNKHNWIGVLCVLIVLVLILLYVNRIREGFVDSALTATDTSLVTAQTAVTAANTAMTAANKAIGTSTELSDANNAFVKADAAVTVATTAVANAKGALGDLNPQTLDIQIKALTDNTATALAKLNAAQKAKTDMEKDGSDYKNAEANVDATKATSAVAKAAAAKTAYEAL